MKILKFICLILLGSLLFQNCSDSEFITVCTQEFVIHTITVLAPTEEPADSVDIKVINKESGEVYPCGEEDLCREIPTGTYIVMHDGFFGDISESGEKILVEGTKDGMQFKEGYIFKSGKCHIEKIAGPDTVSLSSN